jgi:hypothetical protein
MRIQLALATVGLVLCVSASNAQSPVQSIFATCPTPARVYSALQVQTPAKLIPDSSGSQRSGAKPSQSANVVEFVVDTLGVPDTRTLKAHGVADTLDLKRAARAISGWRYSPAIASGCKVPQRVTADVVW